jgi:hypothetical protein
MGQQQLLLLVLATVIVGLATVAGIQAFEQGSVRANQDALTQTAVKIASDIQSQVEEPSQFGGYDGDLGSASGNVTLGELGYETSSNLYSTTDGECAITSGGANSNSASPSNGSEVSASSSSSNIVVTCASSDNDVSVHIDGLNSDGLTTVTNTTAN